MNETTRLLEQMADRADDLALASPLEVRRSGERRTRRQVAGTLMLVAVVVALAIGVALSRPPHPPPPVHPPKPHVGAGLTFDARNGEVVRGVDRQGRPVVLLTRRELHEACHTRPRDDSQRGACSLSLTSWAPDGKRAVILLDGIYGSGSPQDRTIYGHSDVWLLRDGHLQRLFDCPGTPSPDCDPERNSGLSWSPDGHLIAFSSEGRMYVADVDGTDHQPRPLPGCEDCRGESPRWSPDGRWVSFLRPDGVYRFALGHGPAQRVASIPHPSWYAWSPDSTRILSDARDGLYLLDLSSAVPISRHIVDQRGYEGPGSPTWSPDGKRVVWFSTPRANSGFDAQLWTADGDGGGPAILRDFGCCVSDWRPAVWSPDGDQLGFALELDEIDAQVYVLDADSGDVLRRFPGYGPITWR